MSGSFSINIISPRVSKYQPTCSWCSFSMMVKWANDGLLQANDGKMLVNDGEMLVNDGKMSVWSYIHFTIIDEHFAIINEHFTIINKHFTIIRSFDHHWEAAPADMYTYIQGRAYKESFWCNIHLFNHRYTSRVPYLSFNHNSCKKVVK